jgi:hypothetical protein
MLSNNHIFLEKKALEHPQLTTTDCSRPGEKMETIRRSETPGGVVLFFLLVVSPRTEAQHVAPTVDAGVAKAELAAQQSPGWNGLLF